MSRALLLSVLLHAALFGTLELGYQTGWWKATLLFFKQQTRIDQERARQLAQLKALAEARQPKSEEMPLVFIDVDPSQAAPEPPKDAKYYSALNSKAANPDPTLDLPVPKVEGRQDKVPQTLDKSQTQPQPLQPTPPLPPPKVAQNKPEAAAPQPVPKPEPAKLEPAAEPEPEPAVRPGDLAFNKPVEKPRVEPVPAVSEPPSRPVPAPAPQRPRRLEMARREKLGLAGEKMKQTGGVKRYALEPSFDVRATPFGAYDAAIIAAIQKRWYDLLDTRDYAAKYSGKVVLEFRLNSDGRVTDMKVSENGVTEILGLLCQRAVQDPAPFAPWPADLRRLVGREYREVRFTFYYN